MKNYVENSMLEWEYQGSTYRILTQNTFEHSARTEFGQIELKAILKITLQRKEGWFHFLMCGTVWDNIRVEKRSYQELETLGVNFNKFSEVKDEARTIYGMPY